MDDISSAGIGERLEPTSQVSPARPQPREQDSGERRQKQPGDSQDEKEESLEVPAQPPHKVDSLA